MSAATPISPNVTAAAGGGGVGIALSVILVWILTSNGIEVPEEPASAIGAVISSILAVTAGWAKGDRLRDAGAAAIDGAEGP